MEDYKKKYEDANKRVATRFGSNVARELFPDLYESEDERIRKMLIRIFKKADMGGKIFGEGITYKQVVAWLEKQGEQLPVGFYYVNSEGKKFYSDTFKCGDFTFHVENQGGQKETLCDKCRKEQPSHSCQDITALGRCSLEHQSEQIPANSAKTCKDEQKPTDKVEPKCETEKDNDYIKIIKHYGVRNQLKKLSEEVYELQEAVIEYGLMPCEENKGNIVEEMADVMVLLKQFADWFEITPEKIAEIMLNKVDRTLERIKKKE